MTDAKANLIALVEKIQKTHQEYTADATLPDIPDNIKKLLFIEVLDAVRPFWSPATPGQNLLKIYRPCRAIQTCQDIDSSSYIQLLAGEVEFIKFEDGEYWKLIKAEEGWTRINMTTR